MYSIYCPHVWPIVRSKHIAVIKFTRVVVLTVHCVMSLWLTVLLYEWILSANCGEIVNNLWQASSCNSKWLHLEYKLCCLLAECVWRIKLSFTHNSMWQGWKLMKCIDILLLYPILKCVITLTDFHCGFLGYDTVVWYRGTSILEKHTASILTIVVCSVDGAACCS